MAVAVYEKMARYLLVIEHQMVGLHDAEGNESWRQNAGHGKQNAESLSETFTALRAFYDHGLDDDDDDDDAGAGAAAGAATRAPLSEHEAEFTAYHIVYFLDNDRGAEVTNLLGELMKRRKALYATPEVSRAVRVWRAQRDGDYAAFFKELKNAPRFRCAMHKWVASMRARALQVMNRRIASPCRYPSSSNASASNRSPTPRG